MTNVQPLGIFGPKGREDFELSSKVLLSLRNALKPGDRAQIAAYLRSGVVVLALMEYTKDIISDAFGVSGGSAIMTDGRYYWRMDAAEYVEHYGIQLDPDAIGWMERNGWRAPQLSNDEIAVIDRFLYRRLRSN